MRPSKGGGQDPEKLIRNIHTDDVALPDGYKAEAICSGLTFPTAVTFDDKNNIYVIEAGYSYGEVILEPKLFKIESDGSKKLIAKGTRNGPWTGITYHNNNFYVAEGGEMEGGKILRINPNGDIFTLIDSLPSLGDHHTNGPVIKDGYIYFTIGTATNSGVVGTDNADFGWLKRQPGFHDIPCKDITLTGQLFESENPLSADPNDKAITSAFNAFNVHVAEGSVVKGNIPCSGSVLRMPLTGGAVELIAWGFRNPFGISQTKSGQIYVTENGYERGSRPVWGAADVLWKIEEGKWYGWPDYSAGKPISTDEEFQSKGKEKLKPLLLSKPGDIPSPVASFGVHSSSNGFDFATEKFGYNGQAFVAQFGDMSPTVGKVMYPVGFKVVRVDITNGVIEDFAVNKGKRNGPASWLNKGGLERPVDAKFNDTEGALYIVDFGIIKMTPQGPQPQENTGVLWKISKK